jgi:hypothetical protein
VFVAQSVTQKNKTCHYTLPFGWVIGVKNSKEKFLIVSIAAINAREILTPLPENRMVKFQCVIVLRNLAESIQI